jgi:hypothetical protein
VILTAEIREKLITLAKARAEPLANCVAASVPFGHLVDDLPREALYALIAVLAEGADRPVLHVVVEAPNAEDPEDESAAVPEPVPFRLRHAHSEFRRYTREGIARPDMPVEVSDGEDKYQALMHRRGRAAA